MNDEDFLCYQIIFSILYTIAAIPTAQDPDDYYFIGAAIALSCAIFTAATIVIATKVY